ncbi:hypothetical protein STCU_11218 [Strigomonas culicis]|uniref:Uncharacterized protein n=1 Tax=Strigomonas culicis TaxID=28005 RepID=S9V0Z8_9TRYP|nr:hypothetical protein STCU_11218 [Strigomonas culicis]|eukprot:EPY16480.1 hypothetical protein STCU_11218 [Strigomonas culicis]
MDEENAELAGRRAREDTEVRRQADEGARYNTRARRQNVGGALVDPDASATGPAPLTATALQLREEEKVLRRQLEKMENEYMRVTQLRGECGSEVRYAQLHHRIARAQAGLARIEHERLMLQDAETQYVRRIAPSRTSPF